MTKLLRFAGVAILALTIGGVGCGGDDDDPVAPVVPEPVEPAPIVGTVSGTVSVEGSGLEGVSVNLLGESESTGSSGDYSFADVPAGTHIVRISDAPADVVFASTDMSVTIATSGQTATADFSGDYIRTSEISGTVVTAGGEGVEATVTATGKGMLIDEQPKVGASDTDGDFVLTGLRAGDYMVTISEFGDHEFAVISRAVTVVAGQSSSVSFVAEEEPEGTTGSITGQVLTAAGDGIEATVTAVGTGEDGVTVVGGSDTDGDYELLGVEAGDYTVTISEFGDHEFAVSSQAVTVVAGQSASVSFVAEEEPEGTTGSITGQVLTAAGDGIEATVTAVGTGEDGVTVVGGSDTDGDYELLGVEAGDYTVTISEFGDHEFAVSSQAVTVVAGQSASVSFVSGPAPEGTTGSITGQVVTAAGDGIEATVTAVGTGEDGVTVVGGSDTDGDYELLGVEAGDYTVTISEFGDHEFAVSSQAVTVVAGQSASVSFVSEAVPTTGTEGVLRHGRDYITGVTDDDDDAGKTSGLVAATLFFERERGDPLPEKIALYVDGAEVATRGFGGGGAARAAEAPALAAQQGGVEFSLSFDSDEYDPETGKVDYLNGPHVILMGVTFMGSEAENESPPWDIELENDGGYVVTADLGDNSAIGDDGRRWYGGPDNGTIDVTALLVSYTGGSVTSVTANFCREQDTDSDGSDGYTFEFACEDHESKTDADGGAWSPVICSPSRHLAKMA